MGPRLLKVGEVRADRAGTESRELRKQLEEEVFSDREDGMMDVARDRAEEGAFADDIVVEDDLEREDARVQRTRFAPQSGGGNGSA